MAEPVTLDDIRQVIREELEKRAAPTAAAASDRSKRLPSSISANLADSEFSWRKGHARELWMAGKITGSERPGPGGRPALYVSTADCARVEGINL